MCSYFSTGDDKEFSEIFYCTKISAKVVILSSLLLDHFVLRHQDHLQSTGSFFTEAEAAALPSSLQFFFLSSQVS